MENIKKVFTSITDTLIGSSITTEADANAFIKTATSGKFGTYKQLDTGLKDVSVIPSQHNEFLEDLDQFLIKQHINQVLDIEITCRKLFFKEKIAVADGEQVLTNMLLDVAPYDPNAYTPSEYIKMGGVLKEKQTKQYQLFNYKAMIGNTMMSEVVAGAFTSLPNVQAFLSNYSRKLTQSLYYSLYALQIKVLNTSFLNKINMYDDGAFGATGKWGGDLSLVAEQYRQILTQVFKIGNYMKQPTALFNMGYQSDFAKPVPVPIVGSVVGNVKTNKDLAIFCNPSFDATVRTETYSTLFNQEFTNLDKFGGIHPLLIDENQVAFKTYTLTDGTKATVMGDPTSTLSGAVTGKPTSLYIVDCRTAFRWLDRIDTTATGTGLTRQITFFHILFTMFYAVKNGLGVELFYGNKPTKK